MKYTSRAKNWVTCRIDFGTWAASSVKLSIFDLNMKIKPTIDCTREKCCLKCYMFISFPLYCELSLNIH